jgi:heterodisulfide reductase subunit A-like polyferredoxin
MVDESESATSFYRCGNCTNIMGCGGRTELRPYEKYEPQEKKFESDSPACDVCGDITVRTGIVELTDADWAGSRS